MGARMTESSRRAETLRRAAAFASLGSEEREAVALVMREVRAQAGEVLFREGDAGTEAYVVLEGEVDVVQRLSGGSERVRAQFREGELFGELALFGSGSRAAAAVARTDTVLGAIPYDSLLSLIRGWPEIALALMRMQTERFLELERQARALHDSVGKP